MDHELQCVLRNPSVEALQQFQSRMTGSWTIGMAEAVLAALRKRPSSSNLLYLLATSQWDDHVIYAVQQPLKLLTDIALEQQEPLAMVAAARMWEAMERMRSCTSPLSVDTLWLFSHVEPRHLYQMAHVAVKLITSPHDTTVRLDGTPLIDTDVVCEACVSFLSLLLKHDVTDWLHAVEDVMSLANRLEQESNKLHDSHLSSTLSARLALSSVALLSVCQWKHDEFKVQTHTGSLVDYICKVAFPSHSNSPRGPQWICEPMATELKLCALNLLHIFCLTGEQALPDRCWSNFLLDSWAAVLESRGGTSIPNLLFLHTTCRLPARQALHFVLGRKGLKESCRALVASLVNYFQQKDIGIAASSAALLRTLLSDRHNVLTHDELSRSLWSSLDVFPIDKLLDAIVKLAFSDSTSRRACQPLLVGMMDTMELLLSYPEGSRSSLLETNTERVESLIEIMSFRAGANVDLSLSIEEMNEDTPPANNLSRMDESYLSLEPTEEPSKQGLDDIIRIAAATILVRMISGDVSEHTETLWRTRIQTAVVDFTSTFRFHGHPQACADMKRRLFHLQTTLATLSAKNEDVISSSLFAEDLLCRRERDDHAQQVINYHRDLEEARSQVEQLTAERDRCKKAMRLQAAAFEKALTQTKSNATMEASQLIEVHVSERSAAEKRAEECLRRTRHVEELQQEAESRIKEYLSLEAQTRQELSEIAIKLKDAHQELQQQRTLADDHKRRCADQAEELFGMTSRLHMVERDYKTTRDQLAASQAALEETKDAYGKLQDDLEETFAQLSFLAQAYQSKEDEIFAIVEKKDQAVQEARRHADSERRRNDELESNERHLKFENDRLTKKLTRAKEKLEEERNLRHDEAERRKRHAPVSYINQLHTSTTSEASRRAQLSGKSNREEQRRVPGKENRNYASSSGRDYR